MTLSYDYWKDREEKARQQTIKDEEERIKEIEEIYKRMFDEIQRDIDEFFAKYAADEGITIAEAKKRVSKLDMEEFERKAKEYVKNKDFSDQANEEMKLYNLTMKVNRLEMLKAKIGLELVDGYQEIEDYMGEALTETTMKEIERHAGILGKTVGDNQDYAEDIVDASFHNATWSERIWANQDRLKHDLGKLLTSGLIQGKNPRELARDLQKSMNVSKYDAERLMRTEMCRVQIDASLREIEANGFTQFIFIADSGGSRTCEQCKALDGKTFSLKDGKVGVNLPPLHPNCRCSIAGHEDDDDFIDWLENHGVELTDDDLKAMGLSRKDSNKLSQSGEVLNNWTDAEPIRESLSIAEKEELQKHALDKGINLLDLNEFDGDTDLLRREVEALGQIIEMFPILKNKKITLKVNSMHPNDFGETINRTVILNKVALRNESVTLKNLTAKLKNTNKSLLAAQKIEDIVIHEAGHLVSWFVGNKGLELAQKAYYNLYKEELNDEDMADWLADEISIYAAEYSGEPYRSYKRTKYKEIIPEVLVKFSNKPEDEFCKEFIRLLQEEKGAFK